VHVVSNRGLRKQISKHKNCSDAALGWFRVTKKHRWEQLSDVREVFPDTDQVGRVLIFNLRGNAYRLICTVAWRQQTIYVRALLSHAEYDKKEWLKWV
jgi:mRNA interferase HigB